MLVFYVYCFDTNVNRLSYKFCIYILGVKLSEVYDHVVSYVKKEKSEFADKLTKNIGFAMGIEFREGSLLLGGKNEYRAKKGKENIAVIHFINYVFSTSA